MKVIRSSLDGAMKWSIVIGLFVFGKEPFFVTQYEILAQAVIETTDILCE